jgi:signal transduction histidine kinase
VGGGGCAPRTFPPIVTCMLRSRSTYRSLPLVVVLLACLGGIFLAWRISSDAAQAEFKGDFESSVARLVLRVQACLDYPAALLRGAEGLFAVGEDVQESDWRIFAERLSADPGHAEVEALMFIRPGPTGAAAAHEVLYVGPPDAPPNADFNALREALAASRTSGRPQLSPVVLEQGARVALVSAVYRPGAALTTQAERAAAHLGWAAVLLRSQTLISATLVSHLDDDLHIQIFDGRPETSRLIDASGTPTAEPLLREDVPAHLAGREWWLRVQAGPLFARRHASTNPRAVLQVSLAASGVVLMVVLMIHRSREAAVLLGRALEEREAEAQRARAATEAAGAAKDRFMATISHELRTPMTAILGHAEVLLDEALTSQQRQESISTIRRNGDHLLMMINDLLDVSKLEAGKLHVNPAPCNIVRSVDETLALLRPKARLAGLDLAAEYAFPVPASLQIDALRLHQVLLNIVGNAIKFTEAGRVMVRLRAVPESGAVRVEIEVQDTGVGIEADQLAGIFEPFRQGDQSTRRRFGGTGLGLSIARRLARKMGGDIAVQSTPGQGSRFLITLLAKRDGTAEFASLDQALHVARLAQPAAPTRLCGRVLVVDDCPDNLGLIRLWLQAAGADVYTAHTGAECLARVKAGLADGRPCDLILLDMQMPELDGYQTAQRLRSAGCATSIVALTAHTMAGDRERCLKAGCDDYMPKPVSREGLVRCCARWLGRPLTAAA